MQNAEYKLAVLRNVTPSLLEEHVKSLQQLRQLLQNNETCLWRRGASACGRASATGSKAT